MPINILHLTDELIHYLGILKSCLKHVLLALDVPQEISTLRIRQTPRQFALNVHTWNSFRELSLIFHKLTFFAFSLHSEMRILI